MKAILEELEPDQWIPIYEVYWNHRQWVFTDVEEASEFCGFWKLGPITETQMLQGSIDRSWSKIFAILKK